MKNKSRFVPNKMAELARLQNLLGSVFIDEIPKYIEVIHDPNRRDAQPEGWPDTTIGVASLKT